MWMLGQCSGTTPILVRGPGGPRAGVMAAPTPEVQVYTTHYGDITQVVVPPTLYETVQALGYHLGDLYTANHRVKEERALKEKAPTRKGILGLRAWLARHSAVLTPLLRAPTPWWHATPQGWRPSTVPMYPPEAVTEGRVAKTTRMETVYQRRYVIKVTIAMKDTMEKWKSRKMGPGASDVLPAFQRAAEQYEAAPPPGGPPGYQGAGQCSSTCVAVG